MKVNERMRKYIASNGISMKHVADKSDIPQKKFYRIINGKTKMSVDEYESICKGLNVKTSYFFNEKVSENENISA